MRMSEEPMQVLSFAEIPISEQELSKTPFQVLRIGEFYDRRYGKFKVTEDMLAELKKNFDDKTLGIDIALDTNHEPEKGAKAWVDSLEIRDGGLWATFRDFTAEAMQYFKEKIFKYFSVEFAPFTKVDGGKEVTVRNVLRGIALTNRPVIKGMQPTFLSEDIKNSLIYSHTNMSVIKILAERLLQRDKLAKQDVDDLKTAFAALSEEEQAEAKEAVDQVEAKAEADAKEEAEAGKEGEEGKKGDESKEADAATAAELAELRERSEKDATRLAELEAKDAERTLSERVDALTLAADNLTGFAGTKAEDVKAFIKTLSDEQYTKFCEVVKAVQTVDAKMFSEMLWRLMGSK